MRSRTLMASALAAAAPVAFAQRSSITSGPSMVPMATPSRSPVTMAWANDPAVAQSASTLMKTVSSATEGGMMTMSDGSVMSMPSGKSMSSASRTPKGTALAGMSNNTSGADHFYLHGGSLGVVVFLGWTLNF
jgi:hypothetical protein